MSAQHTPMIVAAARVMCKLESEACGVDNEDLWKIYGHEFLNDAETVVQSIAAPELLAELRIARDYIQGHCDELRDAHRIPGTDRLDPADVLDDDLAHLARIDALIAKATGSAA